MKVEVQMKGGRVKMMTPAQARAMVFIGKGQYLTRDMVAAAPGPAVVAQPFASPPAQDAAPVEHAPVDELQSLDKAALHALAKARGVKVHHAAGADKVREALRAAE